MLSDVCDEEEEEESEQSEEEDESDLEGMAPTPKRRKLARGKALKVSLQSGLYPPFRGIESPSRDVNPGDSSAMDYLLLWPSSLCELDMHSREVWQIGEIQALVKFGLSLELLFSWVLEDCTALKITGVRTASWAFQA